MDFDRLQCSIRLSAPENEVGTTVVKAGPGAISVTEVPILMALHGPGCFQSVKVVGTFESTKKAELDRLRQVYHAEVILHCYPGHNPTHVPTKITDVDFPGDVIERTKNKTRAEMIADLAGLGVDAKKNSSAAELEKMLEAATV